MFQEANTGREIISPSEGDGLVMDAVDSPHRISARGIHNHPHHTTYLAFTQRVSTGTGNLTGARRFLRFLDCRVGYLPAGHANLIGWERGSGFDE